MAYDVVIPAAGLGTRLRPLTDYSPKGLVKYKGREILLRQFDILENYDVNQVILVVGYHKEKYYDFLKRNTFNFVVKTVVNEKYDKTGCSYSLYKALNYVRNDFIYINSDLIFTHFAFSKILSHCEDNVIGLRSLKNNSETVLQKVELDGNIVKRMALKLERDYHYEAVGPIKFSLDSKDIIMTKFQSIDSNISKKIPCYSLFGLCLDKIDIEGVLLDENEWSEINTIEDYNANKI